MRHEIEPPQSSSGAVPLQAVRAQLARIVQGPAFARSPRLRRFLTHIVEQTLAGRPETLKEYSLGLDVFDRGAQFDPKADPIVRVDARRLRGALATYYSAEGAGDPIEIVLVAGSYLPVFRLRAGAGTPRRRTGARLAVARFEAQGDDPVTRGFAEGLTDELLLLLTGRQAFQVVAAHRSAAGGDELAAIARELDADVVLTGKVRREGGRLRVWATLTGATDGNQIWSERHDAALDDMGAVLELQDDLGRKIAKLVAPRMRAPWPSRPEPPTHDTEAYELYLRGRHLLNATRPESLAAALALLEDAAARDPAFAEAQAALCEAHFLRGVFLLAPPVEALKRSRAFAQAALSRDPDLAGGHTGLARVSVTLDHDFAAAQASIDRAFLAEPSSPVVREARASWLLTPRGRLDEAEAELASLLDRDPYSLRLRFEYARVLAFQRRFEEAIRHLELILEFEPDFPGAVFALAFAYEHAGRIDLARAAHERHVRRIPYPLVAQWFEVACAVWDGAQDRAHALARDMEADATPVAATVMADAWLRVGELGRALDWLERAAAERLYRIVHIGVDPDYDRLRGEPRFVQLLAHMGLA